MTNMTPLRILLADDHVLFRSGVKAELAAYPDILVVGEASDGFEALELARVSSPDVILMDVSMPRCNGIEALQLIKKEFPGIQVIILTVHVDDNHLFEAIKHGADGYLLKNLKPVELLEMIRKVSQGEAAINGKLAARILNEFRTAEKPQPTPTNPNEALTDRETEVLELVVEGKTNSEIAEVLFVSEHTIKMHLAHILDKLHLQNRVQIAVHAVRGGLLDRIKV